MKKKLFLISIVILSSLFIISCGGGSGVKSNSILGDLPKVYADWDLEEENFSKDGRKIESVDQGLKLQAKYNKAEDKFKLKLESETKKIIGKDVPFEISENLKKSPELFYNIFRSFENS